MSDKKSSYMDLYNGEKYPVVLQRKNVIKKYIKNKDVLDLGVVNHEFEKEKKNTLFHDFIVNNSKSCIGVDIDKIEVEKMKEAGYNVICMDVEKLNLNKKFDVVVGGEIIEHLNNPGLFLESVKKVLKPNGYLILTTPNSFQIGFFIRILFTGKIYINNTHTCYFDPATLSRLLKNYNYKIKEIVWYNHKSTNFLEYIVNLLRRIRKYFSTGFIVVAQL